MAATRHLLADEQSAVRMRHAAIASLWALASLAIGIFLTVVGSELYERTSDRVLWALAGGVGPIGA